MAKQKLCSTEPLIWRTPLSPADTGTVSTTKSTCQGHLLVHSFSQTVGEVCVQQPSCQFHFAALHGENQAVKCCGVPQSRKTTVAHTLYAASAVTTFTYAQLTCDCGVRPAVSCAWSLDGAECVVILEDALVTDYFGSTSSAASGSPTALLLADSWQFPT